MGTSQIDESVVAAILDKHFSEHVTFGDIERWLARTGLNFAHGTVMRWVESVAEKIRGLDDILKKEIQSPRTCTPKRRRWRSATGKWRRRARTNPKTASTSRAGFRPHGARTEARAVRRTTLTILRR